MRAFLPTFLVNCILSVNSCFTDPTHVIEMPKVVEVLASSAFDSAVFYSWPLIIDVKIARNGFKANLARATVTAKTHKNSREL